MHRTDETTFVVEAQGSNVLGFSQLWNWRRDNYIVPCMRGKKKPKISLSSSSSKALIHKDPTRKRR